MDQRIGSVGLVSWQDRKNRRPRPGVSVWAMVLGTSALAGGVALIAQVCGLLAWSGPLAVAPAALVFLAVCSQILVVARAAVSWLVG